MSHAIILSSEDFDALITGFVEAVSQHVAQLLTQAETERVVGREEMAKLLGVGLATIDRSVRDGSIPSMLINSRRLFLPSQVYAALKVERAA